MSHEKYQTGGIFDPRRPVRFEEEVVFEKNAVLGGTVASDNSTHIFDIEGILPNSPSATVIGIQTHIFSAGAPPVTGQVASYILLDEGTTGSGYTIGLWVDNFTKGTGTNWFQGRGNTGIYATSTDDTTGANTALYTFASGGNVNLGAVGQAIGTKNSATNVGGAFFGRNVGTSPIQVGLYAGMNASGLVPTFESAALLVDNSDQGSPIIIARDLGARVWGIEDGGSVQGKMATKTLVEGVPTAFVRISVPQGTTVGGRILYTIEANDGVDFQIISGICPFCAVNKAGSEFGGQGTAAASTEASAASVGNVTNGFTMVSNAADTMDILANATSTLVQTTLRINYRIEMNSNAVVAVTPL